MKKLFAIFNLAVILIVASCGITFAEPVSYNIASANIDVYSSFVKNSEVPTDIVFTIPRTYYFAPTGQINGDFSEIIYQDFKFFIKTSDLAACSSLETKTVDKPFYNLETMAISADNFNFFTDATLTKSFMFNKTNLIDIKFVGFSTIKDKTYFFVSFHYTLPPLIDDNTIFGYIDPVDTTTPQASLATVTIHPNSVPKPPTNEDSEIKEGDKTPAPNAPNSSLIRNILIGVICGLCLVIVFLIFKPTRRNKNNSNNSNRYHDNY